MAQREARHEAGGAASVGSGCDVVEERAEEESCLKKDHLDVHARRGVGSEDEGNNERSTRCEESVRRRAEKARASWGQEGKKICCQALQRDAPRASTPQGTPSTTSHRI